MQIIVSFRPVDWKEVKMSKVNEKRNKKIQEAASEQNWEKVSDLLNQPIENSLRKDRKYGIFSLNTVINTDGQCTEFGDSISESAGDPLDILLEKEKDEQLSVALSILPNNMKQIIIGYYFENKSFAQLSRDLMISDKTIKKHLYSALQQLSESMMKNF